MGTQEARIVIDAPPAEVFDLVADVTRMGEWSPICYRCEWLDGATGPREGVRFRGHNRQSGLRWSRDCVITACERGKRFSFTTYFKGQEATRWHYGFNPSGEGTEVIESNEVVFTPTWVRLGYLLPGVQDKSKQDQLKGMQTTLARIKQAAEQAPRG